MDRPVSAPGAAVREYHTLSVPVRGGDLHVGVWEPAVPADDAPTALVIHGVTASHRAWPWVADALPEVRLIAPDLRGRGRSNTLTGPAGLAAHADDLAAALDAAGVERVAVVGHSMGAFVALALAHRHPARVTRLVLIDGGMPLDVPAGIAVDELVSHILGPTAARLSMRFATVADYLDFWRAHPAFRDDWNARLEDYFAYDLCPADGGLRPATSYETTADDTIDMNTGTTLPEALAGLSHPTVLITVPRGLQNEEPGLYPPDHLADVLARLPQIEHHVVDGLNHYSIVMSDEGAAAVAGHIRAALV